MTRPYANSHPRLAMGFALAASMVVPFADVIAKWLVAEYPVAMVSWARMGFITLILGAVGSAQIGRRLVRPHAWRLQVLRGLSAVIGTSAAFLGFRAMPLAECLAIILVAPVLANLLSHWWLDEPGDARSWVAALASFAGVLVIVRPGAGVFSWEVVYPVVCALSLAFFQASTRAVSGRDDARVTAFFGPFVAFIVFSIAMPFNWVTPRSLLDASLFVGLGVIVAGVQVLQTQAYRHGTTHVVAPFSYLSLVVSIWLGWLVFGAVPDGWSFAGMAVIAGAGVAMMWRR